MPTETERPVLMEESGQDDWRKLTPREMEIVHLVAMDFTYDEIAKELSISRRTAERHVENVFDKVDMHSKRHLAREARRRGLGEDRGPEHLSPDDPSEKDSPQS